MMHGDNDNGAQTQGRRDESKETTSTKCQNVSGAHNKEQILGTTDVVCQRENYSPEGAG